jgi:hypothetical protein
MGINHPGAIRENAALTFDRTRDGKKSVLYPKITTMIR